MHHRLSYRLFLLYTHADCHIDCFSYCLLMHPAVFSCLAPHSSLVNSLIFIMLFRLSVVCCNIKIVINHVRQLRKITIRHDSRHPALAAVRLMRSPEIVGYVPCLDYPRTCLRVPDIRLVEINDWDAAACCEETLIMLCALDLGASMLLRAILNMNTRRKLILVWSATSNARATVNFCFSFLVWGPERFRSGFAGIQTAFFHTAFPCYSSYSGYFFVYLCSE